MTQTYTLSEAARAMESKLRAAGKLITSSKQRLIDTHISAAIRFADNKATCEPVIGTSKPERNKVWAEIYHAEIDRSLKAEGLRV